MDRPSGVPIAYRIDNWEEMDSDGWYIPRDRVIHHLNQAPAPRMSDRRNKSWRRYPREYRDDEELYLLETENGAKTPLFEWPTKKYAYERDVRRGRPIPQVEQSPGPVRTITDRFKNILGLNYHDKNRSRRHYRAREVFGTGEPYRELSHFEYISRNPVWRQAYPPSPSRTGPETSTETFEPLEGPSGYLEYDDEYYDSSSTRDVSRHESRPSSRGIGPSRLRSASSHPHAVTEIVEPSWVTSRRAQSVHRSRYDDHDLPRGRNFFRTHSRAGGNLALTRPEGSSGGYNTRIVAPSGARGGSSRGLSRANSFSRGRNSSRRSGGRSRSGRTREGTQYNIIT